MPSVPKFSKFLKLLAPLAVPFALLARPAGAIELRGPSHGTTRGLLTDRPAWSAGLQIGDYAGSGVAVQKLGFYGGALNLGLGVAHGAPAFSADYLAVLDEDFARLLVSPTASYNDYRARLTPYIGGGLHAGQGLSLRLPAGLQYTMLRDPFTFFGGVVFTVGRFLVDDDGDKFRLWLNVGVRALL